MSVEIVNGGYRPVAVTVRGGREVIAPGASAVVDRHLSDKERAALLAAGCTITEVGAPTQGARAARYAELVAGLTADDLTDAGKPDVHALNALLDDGEAKFTAAERDTLHAGAA